MKKKTLLLVAIVMTFVLATTVLMDRNMSTISGNSFLLLKNIEALSFEEEVQNGTILVIDPAKVKTCWRTYVDYGETNYVYHPTYTVVQHREKVESYKVNACCLYDADRYPVWWAKCSEQNCYPRCMYGDQSEKPEGYPKWVDCDIIENE